MCTYYVLPRQKRLWSKKWANDHLRVNIIRADTYNLLVKDYTKLARRGIYFLFLKVKIVFHF